MSSRPAPRHRLAQREHLGRPLRGRARRDLLRARGRAGDLLDRYRRHRNEPSLLDAAAKAHRRMEVTQTMRKLRRARESGGEPV
jgi:hypothetical protein